ncbi:MAG: tellurite resistance TerB family protein [Bacteroidales bacterium]|nr:tellurite resistance TerB family protein [Bacteroidales bacterium]
MKNPIKVCPICGNKVEGKVDRSLANQATRVGTKGLVGGANYAAMIASGAAVGSAVPVVGTVIGGLAGAATAALTNTFIGKGIDKAGDAIEGNFLDMDFEFTCPNCGHTWSAKGHEEDVEENDEEDEEENKKFSFRVEKVLRHEKKVIVKGVLHSGSAYTGMKVFVDNIGGLNDDISIDDSSEELVSKNEIDNVNEKPIIAKIEKIINIKGLVNGFKKEEEVEYIDEDVCSDSWNFANDCILHLSGINANQIGSIAYIEELDTAEDIDDCINNLSNTEQEYLSEVKSCLADGEIGPRERRLLDKLRDKLGITEERAAALEDSLSSNGLSAEEQEYLTEVKSCLADGEIGPRERRLLDKLRDKLGITEERAATLEASLSSNGLSAEEQEYLTEFKECVEDGVVSDKNRRLLEKLREMSGISVERARELEQM